MTLPDFSFEKEHWVSGLPVLGIDEAGRGAFAGPLAVGGAIFDPRFEKKLLKLGINDSKLLSAKKREVLYSEIKKHTIFSHVEFVSLEIINKVGIGKATTIGMVNIYNRASKVYKNIYLLIDAFKIPLAVSQQAIVHGDRLSVSVAAAGILAKVERDKYMTDLSLKYPGFEWLKNKGYGTKKHREAIKEFGPCLHHRLQFISRYI